MPSPWGQPLRLRLPCSAPGTGGSHELEIEGHWSTRPLPELFWHWSGHMGCWLAYELAVRAARAGIDVRARRTAPPIAMHSDGWRPHGTSVSFTQTEAARDSRTPGYLGSRFGADPRLVEIILAAVDAAHGGVVRPDPLPDPDTAARRQQLTWLWSVGVPSSFVAYVDEALGHDTPCGRQQYVAAALAFGQDDALLPADAVGQFAARTGLSSCDAAATLDEWRAFSPLVSVNDQVLVRYLSPSTTIPSRAALHRFTASVGQDPHDVRSALLLAVVGNVPIAEALWHRGIRSPLAAAAVLAAPDR